MAKCGPCHKFGGPFTDQFRVYTRTRCVRTLEHAVQSTCSTWVTRGRSATVVRNRCPVPVSGTSRSSESSVPQESATCSGERGGLAGLRRQHPRASTASSSGDESQIKRTKRQGDCKRCWNSRWELKYLVMYDVKIDTCTCLKCMPTIETVKKYSLQRHNKQVYP